ESPRARLAATRWPGRLELTPRARDPAGPPVLLFAAMSDKDVSGMLAPLPADWPLVLTGTDSRQAADPTTLHDLLSPGRRGPCVTAEDSPSALRRAAELAGPGGLIVVLGLLRLIGETGTALAPRPE
ncbi:bifunctional folylpolyglutamate synthase/dihydrofolate synthase, partial [Streptomyces sp. SID10115]|nr:bifunctional folylpolyglutamate synthase/dihydrofolate synthase [Streptomyces sp. SID10115]